MRKRIALLAAIVFGAMCSTAYALYEVNDTGTWPTTWPKELEPLRKQARTLVGPMVLNRHYAIRFTNRDEFESAWPYILKVKTPGAPVLLVRGPNFFLGKQNNAGVIVHSPPLPQANHPGNPEVPIAGVTNVRQRWMNTTCIELVVDGEIVDLNRIPLPSDTPIVDERFTDAKKK